MYTALVSNPRSSVPEAVAKDHRHRASFIVLKAMNIIIADEKVFENTPTTKAIIFFSHYIYLHNMFQPLSMGNRDFLQD
jgi:hypothetical protein